MSDWRYGFTTLILNSASLVLVIDNNLLFAWAYVSNQAVSESLF
jgi:hypothetical protein